MAAPYGGFSMEYGDSDGGWVTTAQDLVKIMSSLEEDYNKGVINHKSLKLMFKKPDFHRKGLSWYGFGLDITNWGRGKLSWNHAGHMEGSTSCLARTREGHIFAVLCNYWPPDSDYISLVEYALNKSGLCNSGVEVFTNPVVDAATLDEKYLIKLQISLNELKILEVNLRSQGYYILWLNSYKCKSVLYFNVIWTNEQDYQTDLHMSLAEADACRENLLKQGLTPVHLESYLYNETVCYAIISSKQNLENVIEWEIKLHTEEEHFEEYKDEFTKRGYVPVNISTCDSGTNLLVSCLLYKKKISEKVWLESNLDEKKYEALFNQHARWGHLLTYVNTYSSKSQVKFTAVWSDYGSYYYTSEHNMSKYKLLLDFQFHVGKKFVPRVICGYESEEHGGHHYVAMYAKHVKTR